MLCKTGRSGKDGEHVLPRWLLDMWPAKSGPFTIFRNGSPVLSRDGRVRSQTSSARFKLPVCQECNAVLNERFEEPAKPLVRRLFNRGPALTHNESQVIGCWFVKTWLLLAHPEVRVSDPGWPLRPWQPVRQALYEWMISGSQIPAGLSAWLMRIDREGPPAAATRHLSLPTVIADGRTIEFQVLQFGLGSIDVSLVYHPMWPIDHPLVAEERAAQLWPPRDASILDVRGLALVRPREMAWLKGPSVHFQPNTYGKVSLHPLSDSTDFITDLGQTIEMIRW